MHELMAASDIATSERVDITVHGEGAVDLGISPVVDPVDSRVDLRCADDEPVSEPSEAPASGTTTDLVLVRPDGLPPELAWQERALCAQTDPEAFFPEKGGSTREAKRVCMSCEVRAECLDYALAKDERFGIWGGLSERERRRVKKQAV